MRTELLTSSNKCIATSLLVTSALLVVTMFAIRNNLRTFELGRTSGSLLSGPLSQ